MRVPYQQLGSRQMVENAPTIRPPTTSELLLGPRPPDRLPPRIAAEIRRHDDGSEIMVCLVQLIAISFFAAFYLLTPKAFPAGTAFEPVPLTLAAYGAFTLLRLRLATRGRLQPSLVALSVVVDVSVLMVTIWSFHLQYASTPALYLKAPTLLYVFIIIALRMLRFEPRWVLLAGAVAVLGWAGLLAYAIWSEPMSTMLTHSFKEYATSEKLLIGAEVDKIVSIVVVSLVLAIALERARRTLVRAVVEETAATELSRFFAPDIASAIVGASQRLEPGTGQAREAAVMFIDLRGFTALASHVSPQDIVALLGSYHATVLPIVHRHHGSVITYLGDGIMVTFGAVTGSDHAAADAVRAAENLVEALDAWAGDRQSATGTRLRAGIGVTAGTVVCGAIGGEGRLEYATIGDPVNRAARLQGLTKGEQVPALIATDAWMAARSQGHTPRLTHEPRRCQLAGIDAPVEVIALLPGRPTPS